jgi:hypothetical protein
MLVANNVSYGAVNEAYCLLTSYLREDGKLGAKYDKTELKGFVDFLAGILSHQGNFVDVDRKQPERREDGSLKLKHDPEHDGTGLA